MIQRNSYGREINQYHINFIQMLERMYKVDIETTADFLELRKIWVEEGEHMQMPPRVQPRASQSLRKHTERKAWTPFSTWNKKQNPIKWEDLL